MNISYQFASQIPGPHLLILGSIHGDERCGSLAIERLRTDIASGRIELLKGQVTCIPYANYSACLANERFMHKNLNRIFWETGGSAEHLAAEYIRRHIRKNDFILDLHSFASGQEPFAFNDFDTPEINAVIRCLPVKHVMTGWTSLYQDSPDMDTIAYAKSKNRVGVTVECGQHLDEQAPEIGYGCILAVLTHYGIIRGTEVHADQSWIQVDRIVTKPEGGQFTRPWQNFDPVDAGTAIATDDSGERYAATEPGCIIMPNNQSPVGTEWFYVGKPYPSTSNPWKSNSQHQH